MPSFSALSDSASASDLATAVPAPYFKSTKPRDNIQPTSSSPGMSNKTNATVTNSTQGRRSKRSKAILSLVREFLVSNLVPVGTRPTIRPTTLVQLAVFHFYHSILIFLHVLLSFYFFVIRQYFVVKNNLLAFLYHHHRTPQLIQQDIKGLAKLPEHVAIILKFEDSEEGSGIERLTDDVADVVSWSLGAGVNKLTVYEKDGKLNKLHEQTYKAINETLQLYYGNKTPVIQLHTPHENTWYPENTTPDITVNFISHDDGRQFLVDLTRKFAKNAEKGLLKHEEVTVDYVNSWATKLVIDEPDLVVIFGPDLDLEGFPPWQVRLSEIYHAPYNDAVTYSVFLRGIQRFAKCKINVGR
ncbi:Decaprenyl diphosphate synthase-like protein [Lipomyces japonicus]|uniref:Decaprenyl diphosphate synthase-like protein n=1 Tax=Lipomyces japonicus TaxID=56871 RepID=UPI0034CD5201